MLRDAAQNADDFFFAGIFPVSAEARKYFLRGFFANAAGVIEDQPGRVDRFDLPVSAAEEHPGNFLGIVDIHLAAEGLDVKGIVCRGPGGKRGCAFGRTDVRAGQCIETNVEFLRHSSSQIIPY